MVMPLPASGLPFAGAGELEASVFRSVIALRLADRLHEAAELGGDAPARERITPISLLGEPSADDLVLTASALVAFAETQ